MYNNVCNNFDNGCCCGNHGNCCENSCCSVGCQPGFGGNGGFPLIDCLCGNVGRVVTVFTASGGASGSGFTGLLVWADNQTVKLVTNLPSAPPNPLGDCGCNNGMAWNSNYCNGSMYGSVVVIPTCQIVSFVFSEI